MEKKIFCIEKETDFFNIPNDTENPLIIASSTEYLRFVSSTLIELLKNILLILFVLFLSHF